MPEMLTMEFGRKAFARPRAAPRTLALAIHASCPAVGSERGTARPKVWCLTMG